MGKSKQNGTNFLVQGSILAIASIISRIIGLIYRIPMTEIIGDVGNNYYGGAFDVYNIVLTISSFSLPQAVSKTVSAQVAKGHYKNAYQVFKGAMLFGLGSGLIAALVVYFGAGFFTGTLLKTPYSVFALKVLAPVLVVVAVLGVLRGFFQGLGTMMPSAISQIIEQIANAIAANYPETYLMMLLIDERPEEVTDMSRTVNAEVIASTFDESAANHTRIAQIVLEKAKRMVECGRDVVIFLDSITRLARAFNAITPMSGRILTGGVDANALQMPKRFFGAARNIEGGGSLTIIATALIDTGSKMDEVIFEEFKGTGNMELLLDRNLANKRIFPAVNLIQSSTRREDLLLDEQTVNRMFVTRNYMADMSPVEAMNFLKRRLEDTVSNEEFIATINR